jgi:hypothetical protein
MAEPAVPTIQLRACTHNGVPQPAGVCWACFEEPPDEVVDLVVREQLGLYDEDGDG